MRTREVDVILLGMEVYGFSRQQVAEQTGVCQGTILRVALTGSGREDTLQALELMADAQEAAGRNIRLAGEEAMKLIPADRLDEPRRRRGWIRFNREDILRRVENAGPR
jgi:hypothetical protein